MLLDIFSDPIGTITGFLLLIPGLLLALCGHEAAHGLVAYWCGDPTAKYYGRLTLNPAKHLDPVGTFCMLFLHIGWAKPVPINPNNFRHPRRDDLLVSLAGITANLIMFVIGCVIMYIPLTAALRDLGGMGMDCSMFFQLAFAASSVVEDAFGPTAYYLYEIAANFATINLSLAFFNLLPIPPLDGYHVLNDLILKKNDLFASQKAARIGQAIILLIIFVGPLNDLYSSLMNTIFTGVFNGLGTAAYGLISLTGLL